MKFNNSGKYISVFEFSIHREHVGIIRSTWIYKSALYIKSNEHNTYKPRMNKNTPFIGWHSSPTLAWWSASLLLVHLYAWIWSGLSCFRKALTTNRTFVHVHYTMDKDKAKVTKAHIYGMHAYAYIYYLHVYVRFKSLIPCT